MGLAPKDPVKAKWFFKEALGLPFLGEEVVREQETLTLLFDTAVPEAPGGSGARLEVLVPDPPGAGPIARFLDKKGSGIHHVALTVTELDLLLTALKAKGVRLIDERPRLGAHKTRIAFVHPESTGGLLIELVETLS